MESKRIFAVARIMDCNVLAVNQVTADDLSKFILDEDEIRSDSLDSLATCLKSRSESHKDREFTMVKASDKTYLVTLNNQIRFDIADILANHAADDSPMFALQMQLRNPPNTIAIRPRR